MDGSAGWSAQKEGAGQAGVELLEKHFTSLSEKTVIFLILPEAPSFPLPFPFTPALLVSWALIPFPGALFCSRLLQPC